MIEIQTQDKYNKNRKISLRIPWLHRSCLNVDINTKSAVLKLNRKLNPAILAALGSFQMSCRWHRSLLLGVLPRQHTPFLDSTLPSWCFFFHSCPCHNTGSSGSSPSFWDPVSFLLWITWFTLTAYPDPVLLFPSHFVATLYYIMASIINQYLLTWCVLNTFFIQHPVAVLSSLYFSIHRDRPDCHRYIPGTLYSYNLLVLSWSISEAEYTGPFKLKIRYEPLLKGFKINMMKKCRKAREIYWPTFVFSSLCWRTCIQVTDREKV